MEKIDKFKLNGHSYRVAKKIGEGGQGSAYIVFHGKKNELLVAKFVPITRYNPLSSLMYEVECLQRITQKLDCKKYFLCYIDAGVVDVKTKNVKTSYLVIITDFLSGYITLKDYRKEHEIDEKTEKSIQKQMDDAVDMLKSIGVDHGDLGDSNVMIDPVSKKIRIIDFGFCGLD